MQFAGGIFFEVFFLVEVYHEKKKLDVVLQGLQGIAKLNLCFLRENRFQVHAVHHGAALGDVYAEAHIVFVGQGNIGGAGQQVHNGQVEEEHGNSVALRQVVVDQRQRPLVALPSVQEIGQEKVGETVGFGEFLA